MNPNHLFHYNLIQQQLTASIIAQMMEKVSFSETSVSIYQTTQCNIPEDSHLHTLHHENLKSYQIQPY
jgi:hypothetical protein